MWSGPPHVPFRKCDTYIFSYDRIISSYKKNKQTKPAPISSFMRSKKRDLFENDPENDFGISIIVPCISSLA